MELDIFKQIVKDLKINRVVGENDKDYHARIIYSAISTWIRVSVLNIDLKIDSSNYIGNNKHVNTIENRKVLEGFLELVPASKPWFSTIELKDIIPLIRSRLECIGELISKDNNIVLPDKSSSMYRDRFNKKNIIDSDFSEGYMSGIVWFSKSEEFNEVKLDHYINDSPSIFVEKLIASNEWERMPLDYEYEIFNSNTKKSFHESWEDKTLTSVNGVHLGRHRLQTSLYDYFLITLKEEQTYYTEINSYLRDDYEIYRIYYGLCQSNNNLRKCEILVDNGMGIFKLKDRLPNFEHNLLKSICWPKNNITDDYNYIFNVDILSLIQIIFLRLNITVVLKEII